MVQENSFRQIEESVKDVALKKAYDRLAMTKAQLLNAGFTTRGIVCDISQTMREISAVVGRLKIDE